MRAWFHTGFWFKKEGAVGLRDFAVLADGFELGREHVQDVTVL